MIEQRPTTVNLEREVGRLELLNVDLTTKLLANELIVTAGESQIAYLEESRKFWMWLAVALAAALVVVLATEH